MSGEARTGRLARTAVSRTRPERLIRTHESCTSSTYSSGTRRGSCRGAIEPTVPIRGQNVEKGSGRWLATRIEAPQAGPDRWPAGRRADARDPTPAVPSECRCPSRWTRPARRWIGTCSPPQAQLRSRPTYCRGRFRRRQHTDRSLPAASHGRMPPDSSATQWACHRAARAGRLHRSTDCCSFARSIRTPTGARPSAGPPETRGSDAAATKTEHRRGPGILLHPGLAKPIEAASGPSRDAASTHDLTCAVRGPADTANARRNLLAA